MFRRFTYPAAAPNLVEISAVARVSDRDQAVRPKFSRRPVEFTAPSDQRDASASRIADALASVPPDLSGSMNMLMWQEDIRFGISLVLLLLGFNGLLIVAMPLLPRMHVDNMTTESIAATGRNMPKPVSGWSHGKAPVTFYTTPEQKKSFSDLPYEDAMPSGLSVSPDMFPVPIAKPLDTEQSMPPNSTGYSADAQ
jgi:hypothetical protein